MRELLILGAGTAALGASYGIPGGIVATASGAVGLPGLVLGLAAFSVPALYVGLAATGAPLDPQTVLRACLRGLRSMGLILLGLAPGLLFLVFSVMDPMTGARLCVSTMALAAVVGAGATFVELQESLSAQVVDQQPTWSGLAPLFTLWSAVALGLGYRLMSVVGGVA